MCQGGSVSGTQEVKLLFSIFCSTSTFIWNYLLSLLSAAATGSNVQWNNKQQSFRKYVLLTLAILFLRRFASQQTKRIIVGHTISVILVIFYCQQIDYLLSFETAFYIRSRITIASVLLVPTLSIFVVARPVQHSTCVPGREEESWWGWENICDETIVDDDEWVETELLMIPTGLRETFIVHRDRPRRITFTIKNLQKTIR